MEHYIHLIYILYKGSIWRYRLCYSNGTLYSSNIYYIRGVYGGLDYNTLMEHYIHQLRRNGHRDDNTLGNTIPLLKLQSLILDLPHWPRWLPVTT